MTGWHSITQAASERHIYTHILVHLVKLIHSRSHTFQESQATKLAVGSHASTLCPGASYDYAKPPKELLAFLEDDREII